VVVANRRYRLKDIVRSRATTGVAAVMQSRQGCPRRSELKKKFAKFNADAMTLNDPVQRKSQMHAIFLSSKVVYFKMP
jgi:hypothetical protein